MHETINAATSELVAEFETIKAKAAATCLVCNSSYLSLINELLSRGAGGASLSAFLQKRLSISIGETSIRRHKRNHLIVSDA